VRRARAPVARLTKALVAGDGATAADIAAAYLAATGSRLAVISDLFHPAQYQVGELWYEGRLGVAEEHRATAIVTRVAASLPATPVARPVRRGARCILCGLTRERHVIGLQLLALALEDEGWIVNQLPPPTPGAELVRVVKEWRPDVVGLSAAHLPTTKELTATVGAVKALGVPVMVGGPLFNRAPGLWRTVGADAQGSDARVSTVLMRKYLRQEAP
jgi:methanogenic corrinoid protein MtbC1